MDPNQSTCPNVFVQALNPLTGTSEWKMQPEDYDYKKEVARAAFADMLHDSERNRLYYEGLEAAIRLKRDRREPVHVLDIGTGTGLLSMMAARIGADSITAIEEFRPMAECAQKVMTLNGYWDQIKLVRKRSTFVKVGPGLDMEQRANILVTEVFDTELIGEGAIGTFNHAHEHLLTKDCLVVPTKAIMYAQVVSSDLLSRWNRLHPVSLPNGGSLLPPSEGADSSASLALHDVQLTEIKPEWFSDVSGPQEVFTFDFSGKAPIPKQRQTAAPFESRADAGALDAVFMWWECKMDPKEEITLSCAPRWAHPTPHQMAWRDHWMQAIYYPVSKMGSVKKGDKLSLLSNHDEYSLWFDVAREPREVPMPEPTSGIHLAVSRTRLGQLNDQERNGKLCKSVQAMIDAHKDKSVCLSLSEQSLLPLFAAALGAGRVLVHESNVQFKSFLMDALAENGLTDKVEFLETPLTDLSKEGLPCEVDFVVSEPNFGLSLLPWHNLFYWFCLQQVSGNNKELLPSNVKRAEVWGVPVGYKDLWKIRAPLYDVEGFAMKPFDDIIMSSSKTSDDSVEPHPLWEYPCRAKAAPHRLLNLDLTNPVPGSDVSASHTFTLKDFTGNVNGMALWVVWVLSDGGEITTGPVKSVKVGDYIEWDVHSKQGVHLIDEPGRCQKGVTKVGCELKFRPQEGDFEFKCELL